MGYPKLTPIIASGATEPRYLGDRFADILNVKDFGAKGDGATNDSAAFSAAISAANGRAIYVPDGSYVVDTAYQNANLVCTSDNVSFSKKEVDIQNISLPFDYEILKARRRLVALLDTPQLFIENAAYSSYSWQSFEVTENYIFVGIAAVKTLDSLSYGYISVYDRDGELLTTFCTGVLASETPYNQMLNAFESENTITIYTVTADSASSSNYVAKYILQKSSLPSAESVISPADTYKYTKLRYNGYVTRDRIFTSINSTPFSTITDYTYFKKYDFEGNILGYFKLYDNNSGYGDSAPKTQSVSSDNGIIAAGCGAYCNSSYESITGSMLQGVKIFNSSGEKIFSVLFEPLQLIEKIKTELNDNNITVIENEGVSINSGRIYTITRLKTGGNTQATTAVFEEFSRSPMAIDCSDCLASDNYPSQIMVKNHAVPSIDGNRINPFTGEELAGISDVLDMMVYHGMHEVTVYTQTNKFKMVDGTTNYPDYICIKLIKGNNSTIFCETNGASGVVDTKTISYFNGGVGSWAENLAPLKAVNYYLGAVASTNVYGRIYGYKFSDKSQVEIFRWFSDASESFVQVASDGVDHLNVNLKTNLYVFYSDSFYPNTSNYSKLGKSGNLWSQLYANTSTISTSDERLKSDIEDIDERVFLAWGKVRFCSFKLKDSIKEKGENARIHIGCIAQEIARAFSEEGLDAGRFGLFCYDEWPDEYENVEIVDVEERRDEDGNVTQKQQSHFEKKLTVKAGNQFSLRYEEALALECAYQRWRLGRLEEKINALTNNS